MMLIEHDAVETDLLDELVIDNAFFIQARAFCRIEVLVWEEQGGIAKFTPLFLRIGRHRLLSEVHQMHGDNPPTLGRIPDRPSYWPEQQLEQAAILDTKRTLIS